MAGSGCNAYQIRKIYAIGGALGMVKRNEEDDLLHELVEGMTGKKSICPILNTTPRWETRSPPPMRTM